MKYTFSNLIFILSGFVLSAQPPTLEWQRCYGGSDYEDGTSIISAVDSYIIFGRARSIDGDVIGHHGADDYWAVKLDTTGNIIWQRALGGSAVDFPSSAVKIDGNEILFAGFSFSYDGDVTNNHGNSDVWIVCLDSLGSIVFEKSYGGSDFEGGTYIVKNSSGGFVFSTTTYSNGGDITFNHGASDIWLVNTDSSGNINWQITIGGTADDYCKGFLKTLNNDYLILGEVYSTDGDITTIPKGGKDYWLCRVDSLGNIKWQKNYGGSSDDEIMDASESSDGGFLVVGRSSSIDGDVIGNHGYNDFWLIKTDSMGNLVWRKSYGGSRLDDAWSINTADDNGILIAGISSSYDGDVNSAIDTFSENIWIIMLDSLGNIIWNKSIGGSGVDLAESITSTSDSGIAILGYSGSNDGDVSGNHGATDLILVKLKPSDTKVTNNSSPINEFNLSYTQDKLIVAEFISTTFSIAEIKFFDIAGRMIYSEKFLANPGSNQLTFQLAGKGVYLGDLFVDNSSTIRKIIVY